MDLNEIRKQINDYDNKIEQLFLERMQLVDSVAEYKIANGMQVFQSDRENQVIERVRSNAPENLKDGVQTLFTTIMDIGKCRQYHKILENDCGMEIEPLSLSGHFDVAIPGTVGAYSHVAASKLFADYTPKFFTHFNEVCEAVSRDEVQFGILPIENSTAGMVSQTYSLLKDYDVKIACTTKVEINHCLAVREGVSFEEIEAVYSHQQALSQCSVFLQENKLKNHEFANTALAAEFVKNSPKPVGAICSEDCAKEWGLKILRSNIADAEQNFTRFILISKKNYWSKYADTISVALKTSHTPSALYRLLTKFSVSGLNLVKIESMPIANTDFDVLFYLDFNGSISDPKVKILIRQLGMEMSYFKFLGNYFEA